MKNLIVVSLLILAFAMFFLSCQEAMGPQDIAKDESSEGIQHVISPIEPPPPPPPPPPPCDWEPKTPGFWKNHPDAWPVDVLTIGGVTYPKSVILTIMDSSVKGDKRITLFKALAAAMLNQAVCYAECIEWVINRANYKMGMVDPLPGPMVKKANSWWWKKSEYLYWKLDKFNNYGCWD